MSRAAPGPSPIIWPVGSPGAWPPRGHPGRQANLLERARAQNEPAGGIERRAPRARTAQRPERASASPAGALSNAEPLRSAAVPSGVARADPRPTMRLAANRPAASMRHPAAHSGATVAPPRRRPGLARELVASPTGAGAQMYSTKVARAAEGLGLEAKVKLGTPVPARFEHRRSRSFGTIWCMAVLCVSFHVKRRSGHGQCGRRSNGQALYAGGFGPQHRDHTVGDARASVSRETETAVGHAEVAHGAPAVLRRASTRYGPAGEGDQGRRRDAFRPAWRAQDDRARLTGCGATDPGDVGGRHRRATAAFVISDTLPAGVARRLASRRPCLAARPFPCSPVVSKGMAPSRQTGGCHPMCRNEAWGVRSTYGGRTRLPICRRDGRCRGAPPACDGNARIPRHPARHRREVPAPTRRLASCVPGLMPVPCPRRTVP
jgi:hypothetical protein